MFLLKAIKKLFFLALFGGLIWWGANYKVQGRPVYKIVQGFFTSYGYKEGIKDMKMFFGGLLKSVGEEIQEDVTKEDQKRLDSLIKEKVQEAQPLQQGGQGAKNEPYKKLQN